MVPVKMDKATKKWFAQKGQYIETTLVQCSACSLFYKPQIGHKCKEGRKNEQTHPLCSRKNGRSTGTAS